MNTTDPIQRRKAQAIAAVFGINLVFGALLVGLFPGLTDPASAQATIEELRSSPINFVYQLATLIACFAWLHLDSRQLDIRRPWWLNVGIVLVTSVFVPYYLYKTRPPGQRGQAILSFLGVVFGSVIAMLIGMFLALALHPGTIEPGTRL